MKPDVIKGLVIDKLISALRTVAATKTLEELNSERDSFLQLVTENVKSDLKHNGLTLETATISKLDQTDPRQLKETNIFDAQGLRTIAEITQAARVLKNQIERSAEQTMKQQDVETRKVILAQEQEKETAEQEQQTAIAILTAQKARETREAELAKEKAIAIAEQEKIRASQIAERSAQEAVEVAERKKQTAIAVADAQKAEALANQAKAEAEAEKAKQGIVTVTELAEADRSKQKMVIQAQGQAEKELLSAKQRADAQTYGVEADANARKKAADADAEAVTKKALAEASAAKNAAEGDKAKQMVAVEVARAQADVEKQRQMIPVDVERERVGVLQQELLARKESGDVAQQFELAKLTITSQTQILIETARAKANLLGKVQAQIFGTADDVASMTEKFDFGLKAANMIAGFQAGIDPKTQAGLSSLLGKLGSLIHDVSDSPSTITTEKVES